MGEDNSAGENPRKRPALSDISNRPVKKGYLVIHSRPGRTYKDGEGQLVNDKDKNLPLVHKLCQGIAGVGKEKCGSEGGLIDNSIKGKKAFISEPNCTEINSHKGSFVSGIPKVAYEVEQTNTLPSGNAHSLQDNVGSGSNSILVNMTVVTKDVNEVCADGLVLSQEGSSVGFQHTSQGSNSYALERCTQIKEQCNTLQSDIDMIKDCRCPLCVKASYIWSDLMYQDIKDRLSVIEKSQKQANMLAQRNYSSKGTGVQQGPDSCSKMESDLKCQWKFLFQSMENILGSEATKQEGNLLEFKDLREHFRKELEEINVKPVVED